MTEYRITHVTTYQYSEPVRVCHNLLLLSPRSNERLTCLTHRITIRPTPTVETDRIDFFGNPMRAFSIEESHRQLVVTAASHVRVGPPEIGDLSVGGAWEQVVRAGTDRSGAGWLDAAPFRWDSRRVRRSDEYAAYARPSFPAGRSLLEGVRDLTRRIHADFRYDTTTTHADTPVETAFRQRSGVCQDFAQIGIACLRSLGIAARYVSGYLRTFPPPGKPRLIGADQSHAWLGVHAGELGWVDFDPTNDCLCSTDHVPVAYGRDFHDVVPMRGVFLGGGTHTLAVSVDVAPIETPV